MTRRAGLLLIVLALLAAACGNRSGDDDTATPAGDSDETPSEGSGDGVFTTDIGITDDTITIGVIADLTGVVPGLFKAAADGVEAYAAKTNDEGGVNGRMIEVVEFDTGTNDRGNAQAYEDACDEVFAAVGSESAFDTGGFEAQRECGFPNLAGFLTDPEAESLPNVYPRTSGDVVFVGPARWMAEEHPEAVENAAVFFVNAPVTIRSAEELIEARESIGWNFIYEQPVGQLESNYTPHVIEMENRGVQAFAFVADVNNIVRLQVAMADQNFDVTVADVNTQGYTPDYLEAVGPAGEGSYVPLGHALFEEADQIPAMQEYFEWLEEVAPGEEPTSNGLTAWIRAALFVEAARAIEAEDLTRDALMTELDTIEGFDAGGLIPPDDVGQPVPDEACFLIAQVQDGAYVRVFPDEGFHCSADDIYELQRDG
ncbi:MAG: ABC transporter substrate-binding protein [Acidimicrobiales bacterium]|nr:ABC transporter substrate-binding protein [Acidimicrobiales bacterium]